MCLLLRRSVWIAALAVWVLAVAAGLATLWSYENAPGPVAAAPGTWPASSRIARPGTRPVLIVALHPQCPCSRATVAELSRLVATTDNAADIHVLFVAPRGVEESWIRSTLWETASAIPGIHVSRDDGTEARGFGARVSGQVLAYDRGGRLQFSGGITGSRGHEGDNAGRGALEAFLAGRPHPATTFAFGCLLFDGDGDAAPWAGGAV